MALCCGCGKAMVKRRSLKSHWPAFLPGECAAADVLDLAAAECGPAVVSCGCVGAGCGHDHCCGC